MRSSSLQQTPNAPNAREWTNLCVPEFGYRLAGLTEGEGHFGIIRGNSANGRRCVFYSCVFVVSMRDDDRAFVEWLHDSTGLGAVYQGNTQRQRQGWESRPQVVWRVMSQGDCLQLVELFERYPLRSKKARDFAIWAQAVRYWSGPRPEGLAPMERWWGEIRQVRKYTAAEAEMQEEELEALTLFEVTHV